MPAAPSSLFHTDLYQLAMMQAYFRAGMEETAAFEFFVRKLPPGRGYLVAAGLEQALGYLETLAVQPEDVDWLAAHGDFDDDFLARLASLRFEGSVYAVPEGTIVFADEPILRVVAPLPVAQLVETRLINILHFQTLIASKAARMAAAAEGRTLVDFGYRRAHGSEAGVLAARAAFIAGFDGTATVEAGRAFGIPLYGTMAHSFIQAHETEEDAFRNFAAARPPRLVLLIDTYDTERGAERVARMARELKATGTPLRGVRLDSGDLGRHAINVRAILDHHGLPHVSIFASGGLDENEIARLVAEKAPIDGFGVGTSLTTSSDAPAFDCAYKLQEYAGIPRRKWSEGKATWPGRKQVFRTMENGVMAGDVLGLASEDLPGEPLLRPVMRDGRRVGAPEPLTQARARAAAQIAALPPHLHQAETDPAYKVSPSPALRALADEVDRRLRRDHPD